MAENQDEQLDQIDQDFVAPKNGGNNRIENESENKCVEIAEYFISDIKEQNRTIPTRFAFSGLSKNVFNEGFNNNSFIVDNTYWGFDYNMMNDTKNDSLNIYGSGQIEDRLLGKGLGGFGSDQEELDFIERVKKDYPDISELVIKKLSDYNTAIRNHDKPQKSFREAKYIEETFDPYEKKKRITPNIDKITTMLEKYSAPEQIPLISRIIRNFLTEKPLDEWSFEEQEIWYEGIVADFILSNPSFRDLQLYDIAYLIDYSKIISEQKGYLPGVEKNITAPPESIIGIVKNSGGVAPKNYLIKKMISLFEKNPNISRPIYDYKGDLLWPHQMSHEVVKQFVAERDVAKNTAQETSDTESVDSETPETTEI